MSAPRPCFPGLLLDRLTTAGRERSAHSWGTQGSSDRRLARGLAAASPNFAYKCQLSQASTKPSFPSPLSWVRLVRGLMAPPASASSFLWTVSGVSPNKSPAHESSPGIYLLLGGAGLTWMSQAFHPADISGVVQERIRGKTVRGMQAGWTH